ncbi:MAG TPA: acyltransferase, partial [Polyangia bacterium]|nr:acyltransferase [Polyangia bacterium]
MAKSANRVEALTGARAVAGVYILMVHFGRPLFARAPAWAETLRASGYIATSFFLMLSGFVLTIAYGRKLADGTLSRRGFLVARFARLYPCYALALLLMVPLALVQRWGAATATFGGASLRYKVVTGLGHATMTHVLVPRLVTSWNVPGWCVSIEMWFYVAFPLAAAWLVARRARAIVAVLAGTWAVALALSILYTVVEPDGFRPDHGSTAPWLTLFKFTPYARWPEFFFGCALGALWLRLPAERRGSRFGTLLVGGSVVVTAALLVAGGERIPYTMLHNGTLLPLYGAIVWGLMLGRGPLHRALAVRPLTAVGDSSYAMYTLQVPLMAWLVLAGGRVPNAIDAPFAALALAVII